MFSVQVSAGPQEIPKEHSPRFHWPTGARLIAGAARYAPVVANVSKFVVLEVDGREARIRLLSGAEEWMPLASLPRGVQVGDLVRITEHDGDVELEIEWIGAAHVG